MDEHENDQLEGSLSPEDDARIRRLLAEARHTEPMPADVAARLEDVLADLNTERSKEPAPVVDLAARRRRTAASLLVAAAAVVVVGVGLGQVLPDLRGSSADQATSSGEAPSAESAASDAGGAQAERRPAASPVVPAPSAERAAAAPVRIRAAHFGADVQRARSKEGTSGSDDNTMGMFMAPVCPVGDVGPGTAIAATYDGTPAYLVLRPPAGDSQVVDLYVCGTDEPARTITLPVP
jgi:hypothetical protein